MTDWIQLKVYGLLTGDEEARVCRDIPEQACHHQPANYSLHLVSLALTKTGDKFMDPKITLAWLLTALGAPALILSLLVPVHTAFSLLPQMVVAGYLRSLPIRKWLWCGGAVGQAVALLGICLTALVWRGTAAGWAVLGCLLLFSLSRGVCSVAHKDVLGKTVSRTRRGRLSGYADAAGGLAAIGLAGWLLTGGSRVLQTPVFILLLAAFCWLLAALVFSRMRELPGATGGGDNAIRVALQQLEQLRTEAEFRHFLISRALLLGTALLPPYLVVLSPSLDDQSLTGLGGLLLAASLAGFISAPLWGNLADRSSRSTMLLGALLAGVTGLTVVALTLAGVTADGSLMGALFLIYVGHAGVRIGRKTHLMDMSDSENRAAWVALSNTVIGVAILLLAGFGAMLDNWFEYGGLWFFSLMALCGALACLKLQEVQA